MSYRQWTTREVAALRENYPRGGIDACLAHLQGRSRASIYQHARAAGLRAPGQVAIRQKWPQEAWIDDEIQRLHERPPVAGDIRGLAKRIARPCWYVSRRARELGLKTPRFKELPWTNKEIELLHETAHLSLKSARGRFIKFGFNRSETAIQVKRKRIGTRPDDNGFYSARQICDLMGVNNKTVTRWVHLGELRAKRRGTNRVEAQGGDQWSISESALREFFLTHPLRVNLKKIPDSSRSWFIEVLGRRSA